MNGTVSKLKPIWIWILVPIVVVAELLMQWRIPKGEPSDAQWRSAVKAVKAAKQAGDLLVIAPEWAVQGRLYFREWMGFEHFGRFDTSTYKRLLEVSIDDAKSPESKGRKKLNSKQFGPLSLNTYALPKPAKILYNFTDRWRDGQYDNTGKAPPKLIIDHWFHPRRVLQIGLKRPATLTFKNVPLDGTLRGYAIIGYREGRFNKGAPIRLRIYLNNKKIVEKQVANFSKVTPISFPINQDGKGEIRFKVDAEDNKKRQFGIAFDIRR